MTKRTGPEAKTAEARQAWLDKFEELAKRNVDETGDEWESLLKLLGLPLSSFLAVHEVIRQGRWADAEYPRAYVRSAAMIEARKMHLSIPHKDDTLECGDPHLVFMAGNDLDRNTRREAVEAALVAENREHGKQPPPPMKGRHYVAEQFSAEFREEKVWESRPALPHDWWIKEDPPSWYLQQVETFNRSHNDRHITVQPAYTPDWEKWAQKAGLDSWQLKVLEYRKDGVSRDGALDDQPDEDSRKALQAAWKRLDRSGMKKLKECAIKMQSDCPE